MRNKYPKPPLQLNYWCATRKDLYMLYELFRTNFDPKDITILLETHAGNNRTYLNFEEFSEDIEYILSLDDKIEKLVIVGNETDPQNTGKRKSLWLTIEFVFNATRFTIFAHDTDSSLKDWIEDTYKEMVRLFDLFKPSKEFVEILRRDFSHTWPDRRARREQGIVVFDYDGNIKDRIWNELKNPAKPEAGPAPRKSSWLMWIKEPKIRNGLLGSLILFALLILSLYFFN